jgi:hypothetical protein
LTFVEVELTYLRGVLWMRREDEYVLGLASTWVKEVSCFQVVEVEMECRHREIIGGSLLVAQSSPLMWVMKASWEMGPRGRMARAEAGVWVTEEAAELVSVLTAV